MRYLLCGVLLCGVSVAAAGCGSDGGSTSTTRPASPSRADVPASPAASPAASPPRAAEADAKPTTRQVLGLPAGWELAPRANYTARQAAGQVTVTAKGESPTAGYDVKLFESPLRIWPPQWMLAHKKPDGMVAQVVTPFEANASFKSDRPVVTVVVHDGSGRRLVSVGQDQK